MESHITEKFLYGKGHHNSDKAGSQYGKRSLLTKLPRDGQYMNYKTNKWTNKIWTSRKEIAQLKMGSRPQHRVL